MGDEIPLCPLCHTPRMPRKKGDAWFWGCQNYLTCTAPTTTAPQDAAVEAAPNPGRPRQDPGERMSSPPGQDLGQRHGKGNHVPTVWSHHQRQRRDYRDQQVDPTATDDHRDTVSLQPKCGWAHGVGPIAGRDRRGQTIAGGSPRGSTSRSGQSGRISMPVGRTCGRNRQAQEPDGSESGLSRSLKTGQRKRLLGKIKITQKVWAKWNEASEERERQGKRSHHSPVHRFCEVTTTRVRAVLQRAPTDLRGGTFRQHSRVLVATLRFQVNPLTSSQILHAAMYKILRGASVLLRALSTTEDREARELLVEIQQQPEVLVLRGPAIAITDVGTASEFLADGWPTESVSRVVRAARTKQEYHEKERAEHALCTHIQDEMPTFDVSQPRIRESRNVNLPQRRQNLETTRTKRKNNRSLTPCQCEGK